MSACRCLSLIHRERLARSMDLACKDDEIRKPAAVLPAGQSPWQSETPDISPAVKAALSCFLHAGEKPEEMLLSMK